MLLFPLITQKGRCRATNNSMTAAEIIAVSVQYTIGKQLALDPNEL
jgi:hypothetical protein